MIYELPIAASPGEVLAPVTVCPPKGLIPAGRVFWVNGADTDNALDYVGYGTLAAPFLTIAYAITQCVSGRGDLILVKQTHDETPASAVVVNVSRLTIAGLGPTWYGPLYTIDAAADRELTITADDVTVLNLRFHNGGDESTEGAIIINGSRVVIAGCNIFPSTKMIMGPIYINALTGTVVEDVAIVGNRISNAGITGFTGDNGDGGIRLDGADGSIARVLIKHNLVIGQYVEACIYMDSDATVDDVVVIDNWLYNNYDTSNGRSAIFIQNNATGAIERNRGRVHASDSITYTVTPADCSANQNYVTNDLTKSGILIPAA